MSFVVHVWQLERGENGRKSMKMSYDQNRVYVLLLLLCECTSTNKLINAFTLVGSIY